MGLPSAAKAQHYAGAPGLVAYLTVLVAAVWALRRLNVGAIAASITHRRANAVLVMTLVALALAFVVVYPRATAGSDRDDALDLATRELLRGHSPYYRRVFATGALPLPGGGNAISPMPGARRFIHGEAPLLDWGIPHTVTVAAVVGSIVAAMVLARQEAASDASVLTRSAIVLAVPAIAAVVLACARQGATEFAEYGWYAVSSMPFGVLGALAFSPDPEPDRTE